MTDYQSCKEMGDYVSLSRDIQANCKLLQGTAYKRYTTSQLQEAAWRIPI
jgi:hypothetical protein